MLCLITLSGILPLYSGDIFGLRGQALYPFAPLIVLTNAVILSVAQVVFNISRNVAYYSKNSGKLFEGLQHESASRKAFALIIGHRSANPQYSFPIERLVGGKREFDFALRNAETAEYESKRDVWVTTGTPFLLYFFAGYIAMILGGDILIRAIRAFQGLS
jgi:preflagellin peptidase FlaK